MHLMYSEGELPAAFTGAAQPCGIAQSTSPEYPATLGGVVAMRSGGADDKLLAEQAHVLELIVQGHPLPEVLGALCAIVERCAERAVHAVILLVDASGKHLCTGAGPSLPETYHRAVDGLAIAPDVGTCASAAALGEVVVTRDIASDPGWAALRHLPLELGLVAAWSMPILSSTGAVLGTFGTYFTEPREPTDHERRLVEVLAHTAALAIERDQADRALRHHATRQKFLADLDAATQALSEPTAVMAATARLLAEHVGADRCAYADVEDERVFNITGDHPRGVPSIVGRWEIAAFGPECVRQMLAGEPYVVDDADADPRITAEHRSAYRATSIRGVVCVPLHKAGRLTAAMAVHQTLPRRWSPDEIELVGVVVARCWEALERSRVTRDLRESEARYRAIVEATPECVNLLAADGTLLQMNAAGLRMLEVAAEAEVVGASMYPMIAPEDRDAFRAFNEAVCRGEGGSLAFEIVGARGTRRAMETEAVPLPSPTGGFIHLAVSRDVSARAAADRALAESRARLDYAVRLSGVGFWYCDLPFDELRWDARVKAHFFLPPDARATIDMFYDRIHPDDRQPTHEAIDASIANHSSYDVVYRTVDPPTGSIKWIRALGGAAYGKDGTPIRFDGVTVDVTAQKLDEQKLRDQERRKDELIAMLAHELRNPLAPIRTGLHVLQHAVTADQLLRTREMMDRQLTHLVRMVDDLLDISRVTLGKITLERARIDLRSVLGSAIEATRPLVEAGGHELAVQLPSQPLPLDADPARMSQAFANLINNAAKYTPRGGRILITGEADATTVTVRVTDTGVGIPAEMLAHVFDMFTQVGRTIEHPQGGLGIGLTLVRRLIDLHGGSIVAESAGHGHGSSFVVKLPLAQPVVAGACPATTGLKILVVDDNVDAAEMLAMLLELRGNQTRLAHTGPAALDAAAELQPHVILLDIGLPGLSGYEVARRLRADPAQHQPLLVAVTGWGSDDDRRQAKAAGFDQHLVKPVNIERLEAVLGNFRRAAD